MALSKKRKFMMMSQLLITEMDENNFIFLGQPRRKIKFISLLLDDEHVRAPLFFENWVCLYLESDFFGHFRMIKETYYELCFKIGNLYTPRYVGGRMPVGVEKSLLACLWYLAKGDTINSVADRFNLSLSAVHDAITYMLNAMKMLATEFIAWPTEAECVEISQMFHRETGYPGVIGAIDGCHFKCKVPAEQQDSYQDRYRQHSVTMQGICTWDRKFINVSAGYPGSLHDARILKESHLYRKIDRNGYEGTFYGKYHLVGDSAYPCLTWLMTPFRNLPNISRSQRRHNLTLSRARVKIEHSFGALKGRWRLLLYLNVYSIERAAAIIIACCFLHNYCLPRNDEFPEEALGENAMVYENLYDDDREGIQKRNIICQFLSNVQ